MMKGADQGALHWTGQCHMSKVEDMALSRAARIALSGLDIVANACQLQLARSTTVLSSATTASARIVTLTV